ncbi:MAG: hypothetical protein V7K21_00770 [Nostoc sp.]|uniref:hypothetical protein n=1 Tax=Nostoc sp. TaxID=1180 RepID=UPI002FF5BB1F
MIGKAIARVLTCQFAVWDIADLGLRLRIYLNLVSSYLCYDAYDQFLALLTKSSDRIPDMTPGGNHAI